MTALGTRWSGRTIVLIAGGLAVAVALSLRQGAHEQVGNDFQVFWQAGRNFASGGPLYHGYLPGARQFKYPPFAAFLFQPLAAFPLPGAAALFSLLNLLLWVAAVYLTRDIVARTSPFRPRPVLPLLAAVVLSAQFFLDNFHHVQMNGVIFVLVLLGLRAYLRGHDVRAATYAVVATAIKITPVFFAGWLVLRGRPRAAWAVPALTLGCVLLPLLLRGPATGTADLAEYYHSFLEGHQHGEVGGYPAGQNLAALVNRMTQPTENAERVSYRYFPTSERTAQHLYQTLWVSVLALFLAKLVLLRVGRAPPSAVELSMVFLTGLLLSPITFTHHLVSLLFVFYGFLVIPWRTLAPAARPVAALACVGMAVTGLSGRDLVGRTAYLSIKGYSLMAWTMALLFVLAAAIAGRGASGGSE